MPRMLMIGSTGPEVVALQSRLNALMPLVPPPLDTDGVFGPRTRARVVMFQETNGLVPDGIVGPLTWAKLREDSPALGRPPLYCDCGSHAGVDPALAHMLSDFLAAQSGGGLHASSEGAAGAASSSGSFLGITLPSLPSLPSAPKLRRLTLGEEVILDPFYGSSIDYSTVVLSDKTGAGGRAFVVAVPPPLGIGKAIQIVNIGTTFTNHTLVHEMGHVWQSQHHSSATAYMVNAVASQAAAEAANLAFKSTTWSAYGYVPGKAFDQYGAEQIAQMAANNETAIVAHMKGVAKNVVDKDLVTAMKTPRIEDTSKAGVKH